MKYLFLLSMLVSLSASAQQWKSYKIGPKGDTLNRLDMNDVRQGPWVVRVDELRGERGYEEEGYFVNGKKEGIWRRYSLEGDLIALENYKWGQRDGKNIYFTNAGEPLREESWKAIDPKNPYDTVDVYDVNDPGKVIRREIIKVNEASVKHGTWKYYDHFSNSVETEQWILGRLKKDMMVDELAPLDIAGKDAGGKTGEKETKKTVAKPKEVVEFEKKNAGKKIKVRDGRTGQ